MRWTKFIHLTDTHLIEPGALLYGNDPLQRVQAALDSICREHGDADFVLVTGDLAHTGQPAAYRALQQAFSRLPMPVRWVIGNHDDREAFCAQFTAVPRDTNGFVQQRLALPLGELLILDTNAPGVPYGVFCAQRQAWLAEALASSAEAPLYIAMHHPPFDVGLASMDAIGLKDAAAFEAVLAPHRHRVRHLFFGHVHRPISGSWCGVPFSTLRATNHQVAFDLHAEEVPGSFEPPAYAVVLAHAQQTLVHNHDFLDASPRFPL